MPIRILHIEDNICDAELISHVIFKHIRDSTIRHVRTEKEFHVALGETEYDLILADYRLGPYDGLQALQASQEVRPDTPFILVTDSGDSDFVVKSFRKGARDVVSKSNLMDLVPSIVRVLAVASIRRQQADAMKTLERANLELIEMTRSIGEERNLYESLFDLVPDAYIVTDDVGRIFNANNTAAILLGQSKPRMIGRPIFDFVQETSQRSLRTRLEQIAGNGEQIKEAETIIVSDQAHGVRAAIRIAHVGARNGSSSRLYWLFHAMDETKPHTPLVGLGAPVTQLKKA
jgi:PAS domain S-box-containing protein